MTNFIGPALPPHLLKIDSNDKESNDKKNNPNPRKDDVDIGPNLPPHILRAASEDTISSDWERGPPHLHRKQITQSEMSEDSADDLIGPLPVQCHDINDPLKSPGSSIGQAEQTKIKMTKNTTLKSRDSSEDEGPVMIGPVMPQHLLDSSDEEGSQESSEKICVIGPRLPSFIGKKDEQRKYTFQEYNKNKEKIIGPSLPEYLAERADEMPTIENDVTVVVTSKAAVSPVHPHKLSQDPSQAVATTDLDMYGPALPPGFRPKTLPVETISNNQNNDCDSDDDVGPLPEGISSGSKVQHQLEIRAKQLRHNMSCERTETEEGPVRESWMLELPADRAPELGLKPRQFRMREAPDTGDKSVWTDTPADRERKKKSSKSISPDRGVLERQAVRQRDEVMQKIAEKHSSKRGSRSLVELHEEKLAAKRMKAEAEGQVKERRPFSRELDLQVNRFDEAQKRSIMKKAQHLNDRFSSGQSKFL